MLVDHDVDAALGEQGDVEPAAEIAVREHHVALGERGVQRAKQAVLARLLSLVRADGGLDHGAHRQRKHHQHPRDRQAAAGRLRLGLRILGLVLGRVGHRDRRTVDYAHATPPPQPRLRRLGFEFSAAAADQFAAGRLRQRIARRAVSARVGRTRRETLGRPPSRQAGHSVATRMVRAQTLRQEHPHRDGGRVNPALPKRACLAERFADTLSVDERRKVQIAMPTCLCDGSTKRMKHLGPPC